MDTNPGTINTPFQKFWIQKFLFFLLFLLLLLLFSINIYADSSKVSLVGRYSEGPCTAVFVYDSIAIIGNGSSIEILDITNPDTLISISKTELGYSIKDLYADENKVYCAAENYFYVVDIYNLKEPQIIFTYPVEYSTLQIYALNNLVYFSDYYHVSVLDMNSPNPERYDIHETLEGYGRFYIKDSLMFVCDTENGLYTYNIADISSPELLSFYNFNEEYKPYYITGRDSIIFVSTAENFVGSERYGELFIINVKNPAEPSVIFQMYYPGGDWVVFGRNLVLKNDTLFAAFGSDTDEGFMVLDVADSHFPKMIGESEDISVLDIAEYKGKVFVAEGDGGLAILEKDSVEYKRVSGYPIGSSKAICIVENNAFLAAGSVLKILDLENNLEVKSIVSFGNHGSVREVIVENDIAYVVTNNGINIVSVADPDRPEIITSYPGLYNLSIRKYNNYIYAAERSYGLIVIDVSNPNTPQQVYQFKEPLSPFGFFVGNNYCIISTQDNGVYIFDISNEENISIAGQLNGLLYPRSFYSKDNYLFVGQTEHGITIYDITDISNPVIKGELLYNAQPGKMDIINNRLYVADLWNGLLIADVSNPALPEIIDSYDANISGEFFIDNGLIYLIEDDAGFSILRDDNAVSVQDENIISSHALLQNYPNPFNPVTSMQYAVGSRQFVKLAIYDLLGREVTTLVNEVKAPGTYTVKFDASNLASGTYFYRLTAGEYVSVKKMMVLK